MSPDYTWSESYLGMLSAVGCMFGVFLCSVPAMPLILQALRASRIASSFHRAVSSWSTNPWGSTLSQRGVPTEVESRPADISGSANDVVVVIREVDEGSVHEQDGIVYDMEASETKNFEYRRSYTV